MSNPTDPASAAAIAATPAAPSPDAVATPAAAPSATPPAAPAAPAAPASPASPPITSPLSPITPSPDPDATLNIFAPPAPDAAKPITPSLSPITSPDAPTPEQLAERQTAIAAAVKPADLGLGTAPDGTPVGWDADAVSAVSAVAAKHNLPPAAVADIVEAYAARARAQYADAAREEADVNRAMVAELRAQHGPDLARRSAEADRGGLSVFGPELWAELRAVNVFANEPRIFAALAARGRAISDDPVPAGTGTKTDDRDLASRLYSDLPK